MSLLTGQVVFFKIVSTVLPFKFLMIDAIEVAAGKKLGGTGVRR